MRMDGTVRLKLRSFEAEAGAVLRLTDVGTFGSLLRAGVMVEKKSAGFMGNPV